MNNLRFGHYGFDKSLEIKLKQVLQAVTDIPDSHSFSWQPAWKSTAPQADLVFVWLDQQQSMAEIRSLMGLPNSIRWIGVFSDKQWAFDAWKAGASDGLMWPIEPTALLQSIQHCLLDRNASAPFHVHSLQLGIRSYGDHRYFKADDIIYLKADNNSTDLHLLHETITAFKTLKYFEQSLPFPHFVRIHNSYIVNAHHIKRIQTGHGVCYLGPERIKIPFSKSYKTHIDFLIRQFAQGNYLEL